VDLHLLFVLTVERGRFPLYPQRKMGTIPSQRNSRRYRPFQNEMRRCFFDGYSVKGPFNGTRALLKVIKFEIIGIKCWIMKGMRSIIQLIKINDIKIEVLLSGNKGPLVIDSTGIGKLC